LSVTLNGTTTPILSNATYDPFGAVRGWTWGNGATVIRSHNTDGNTSVISSSGLHLSFQYDNALRTQNVSDLDTAALSWTYSYDVLDRLTAASDASNSESWTYDGNGNRITQTGNYGAASLLYNANNNQFQASTYYYPGGGYSGGYDAAGNSSVVGGTEVVYDAEGSLFVQVGATNGLRQRVVSETGPVEQRIVYDDEGHIVGEYHYDAADYVPPLIPLEETIWLGDLPVATMMSTEQYDQNGNPTELNTVTYYVHADQLGSPRRLTRPGDNQLLWRWDSDPFGFKFGSGDYTAAQSDPLGLGVYAVYNLRFPGQLRGPEVDTFYNWFRDYDPLSGRYSQSDPIGLQGGTYSTYQYTSGNPISRFDRRGLCSNPEADEANALASLGPAILNYLASNPDMALAVILSGLTDSDAITVADAVDGVFLSETTNAGGKLITSAGTITQDTVTPIVTDAVSAGSDVSILSGVHGAPDGSMVTSVAMIQSDAAAFGGLPGVTVYDMNELLENPSALNAIINGPTTIIGAFCNSGVCLAPYR
jgi:RHS repeat-associated protein